MLTKMMAALRRHIAMIPEGQLSAVARRGGVSVRQLRRLRNGELEDVKLSTIARLAEALKVAGPELLGGASPHAKRPAPTGRRRGKPRTMRRQGDVGDWPAFDEDYEDEDGVIL